MTSSFSKRLLRSATVVLAAAAFVSPVARAQHAPGEEPRATQSPVSVPDWADAGVGAGTAGLALALGAGLRMLVVRGRRGEQVLSLPIPKEL